MITNQPFSRLLALLSLLLILSILLTGCGDAQIAGVSVDNATPSTVPSNPSTPTNTITPVPTETPTLTPTATTTATRTATPNRTATQAVVRTATQAAFDEMVNAELVKYGIDPSLGHVAWVMKGPVELDGTGYALGWYKPIQELGVLKDFVVQTEITWDTSGGLSGCGYVFRAREDFDLEIGDFYNFYMMRLQFAPLWFFEYYQDGRWQYSLPNLSGVSSANIQDGKMSKNILTLDARGDTFTIYINGVKERVIENNKLTEGRLALEVVQESGTSYCLFNKGWVWEYDE